MALARRLHEGLTTQGHRLLTPPGNGSAIVVFEHDHDPDAVRRSLEEAAVRLTLRDGGAQVRVGAALFNNEREIDTAPGNHGWLGSATSATVTR